MKRLVLAYLLVLLPLISFSQDMDLTYIHALKNKEGDINIEISGYTISIWNIGKATIDESIKSVKQRFKIKDITANYSKSELGIENKVLESQTQLNSSNDVKAHQICYLLKHPDNDLTVIFMQTINQRDILLEDDFVKAYIDEQLVEYISINTQATSISFAGREIKLDSTCEWKSPHNIYCLGGQMSWSEFSSFESAMLNTNNHILLNAKDNLQILKEEDIDVVFEDIPSLAHRVVYKDKNSQPLIVYYLVQEIRGRYISCIMSNYGYSENDYELAPLLQLVMSIPELPEPAQRQTYNPDNSSYTDEDIENEKKLSLYEIRAGVLLPLGNMSKAFKAAPSFGAYVGLPISKKMAIDLGLNIAIPTSRRHFEYFYDRRIYDVKSDLLVNINARWRYEQELAKNVYFTNYAGIGLASLQTDLEKEDYDDDSYEQWHSVQTIDLFGGVSLRYKKVGCFLEYHYTPYSIGGKVKESFGASAINIGMLVAF